MSNKQIVMLNEVSDGYYIHKSELDTEEKYNQAVDVFKLFGYTRSGGFALPYTKFMHHQRENALICHNGLLMGTNTSAKMCSIDGVKLGFNQLMNIGELKRSMNSDLATEADNKACEAYRILNEMDCHYDEEKRKWFKRVWL